MVYLKSVENVKTLGKLIGLLFLFCLPLLSILFLKTKRNDLARPVMGTIFLVSRSFQLIRDSSMICTQMLTNFISISSYSPEVSAFGTLITSTNVFSLIICKTL